MNLKSEEQAVLHSVFAHVTSEYNILFSWDKCCICLIYKVSHRVTAQKTQQEGQELNIACVSDVENVSSNNKD